MFDIVFYKYEGLPNVLNKTLENGLTISCNFNIEYNLVHPKIKLVLDSFDYNYCYIPIVNRYYFVDSVNVNRNNFFEISLDEDILQTYNSFIKTLYGTVTESKDAYYYKGANFPVKEGYKIKKYEFEKTPYNKDGNIILIGVGSV